MILEYSLFSKQLSIEVQLICAVPGAQQRDPVTHTDARSVSDTFPSGSLPPLRLISGFPKHLLPWLLQNMSSLAQASSLGQLPQ